MAPIMDPSPPIGSRARRRWWAGIPAVWLSTLLLLAGGYFGSTQRFGAFLFSIPVLASLLLIAVVAAIRASMKRAGRAHLLVAWLLIGLTPLAYLESYDAVQQIRFLVWAATHYRQVSEVVKANNIVMGWDSWGMAGQDNFSYLVVDVDDRLESKDRAIRWTKQVGQSCGLWKTQRVWPEIYIATTYTNCPFNGIEPAE